MKTNLSEGEEMRTFFEVNKKSLQRCNSCDKLLLPFLKSFQFEKNILCKICYINQNLSLEHLIFPDEDEHENIGSYYLKIYYIDIRYL
jgi:hypothetical protein